MKLTIFLLPTQQIFRRFPSRSIFFLSYSSSWVDAVTWKWLLFFFFLSIDPDEVEALQELAFTPADCLVLKLLSAFKLTPSSRAGMADLTESVLATATAEA